MVWSVCIFAHNEERLLPQCLKALGEAAAGADCFAHIMENGSTDKTALVAEALANADPRVTAHHIALADKANAWNQYVHAVADEDAQIHVFVDGDVRPARGALKAFEKAFEAAPEAYAAAALPASGRSRTSWAARLFLNRYISGNLYAMTGEAIRRFRERNIRLPIGAVGEDGILSYLMLTDLAGGRDDSHRQRITIAADAFFEFESLQPNLRDLQIYRRRLRRYSRRHFQAQILYAHLKERGIGAMPKHIDEIYTLPSLAPLRPRADPVNFLVDRAILKRLRAEAAARGR